MDQGLENYVILHGSDHPDLLVSLPLTHYRLHWNQSNEALSQEDSFMIPLYLFSRFLKMLRDDPVYDGNGNKLSNYLRELAFEDIIAKRDHYRGEYIDARFTRGVEETLNITYNKVETDGTIKNVTEPLQEGLMNDEKIDLNYWLENVTLQGLPSGNQGYGDLSYLYPKDNRVARFSTDLDGIYLCCNANPRSANARLGVRLVRFRQK